MHRRIITVIAIIGYLSLPVAWYLIKSYTHGSGIFKVDRVQICK